MPTPIIGPGPQPMVTITLDQYNQMLEQIVRLKNYLSTSESSRMMAAMRYLVFLTAQATGSGWQDYIKELTAQGINVSIKHSERPGFEKFDPSAISIEFTNQKK